MLPGQLNRKQPFELIKVLSNLGMNPQLSHWDNQKTRYLNLILMVATVSAAVFVGVNFFFGNLPMMIAGGGIILFNSLLFTLHFFGHPYTARMLCALFYPLVSFAMVILSKGQASGEYAYFIMLLLSVMFFRRRGRQLNMMAYLTGFFVIGEVINAQHYTAVIPYRSILNETIIFVATTYILIVMTDIFIKQIIATRRKNTQLLQDLSTSNEELKRLNYMVSHDLRTPLRQIVSFSDLAMMASKENNQATAREFMQEVGSSARRLYLLTDELLSLANLNDAQLVNETIQLQALFAGTTQQFISSQTLVLFETDHQHLEIEGNADLLTMALQNLIENGIKYNESEQKVIRLSATENERYVEITVQDNGIGIAPTYQEKIFEAFQRLHGKDVYQGSGLGLAIVKKIVNLHGGTIKVTSSDSGSKFVVYLPKSGKKNHELTGKKVEETTLKVLHKVKHQRAIL